MAVVKPFVPAGEKLAELLSTTNGSLAEVTNGTVIRIGATHEPWDIANAWQGREIEGYRTRYSAWNKAWLVSFTAPLSSGGEFAQFTVSLAGDLPEDEVHRSADTYMMLLNTRRLG